MKYAIFDLDGTLIDSMSVWRSVTDEYIKTLGIKGGVPEIKKIEKTKWREELIRILKEKYNIEINLDEVYKWVYDFMIEQYANHITLKPSSRELLDKFLNDGVKMCICTSSDSELIKPLLKNRDMEKYFEFYVHCKDFGKEKDDPEIFLYCMKKLGAKEPSEVMVFEDALYSAKTAKENGFYVIGRKDDTEHNQEGLKEVSHQYVEDFTQLDYLELYK